MQLSLFIWARETPRNFPDRVGATLLGPRRSSPPWAAQNAFTNTENGDLEVDTKSSLWIAGARWHTACGDKDSQVSQWKICELRFGNSPVQGLALSTCKISDFGVRAFHRPMGCHLWPFQALLNTRLLDTVLTSRF